MLWYDVKYMNKPSQTFNPLVGLRIRAKLNVIAAINWTIVLWFDIDKRYIRGLAFPNAPGPDSSWEHDSVGIGASPPQFSWAVMAAGVGAQHWRMVERRKGWSSSSSIESIPRLCGNQAIECMEMLVPCCLPVSHIRNSDLKHGRYPILFGP